MFYSVGSYSIYKVNPNVSGGTPTPPSFADTTSFTFDGVDDYIEVADADNLSFGNGTTDSPFSISAWVNMTDATRFRIVFKADNSTGNNEYGFYTDNTDNITFRLYDSVLTTYVSRIYLTSLTSFQGQWIHLVGTYDGRGGSLASDGIKIYLNGSRVDDVTLNQGTYVAMQNGNAPLNIGNFVTSSYANGLIDEVAVFDVELSSTEVTSIFNLGIPNDLNNIGLTKNPLSWWRMGENATWNGSEWSLTDNGSGGNDGRSQNMVLASRSNDVPNLYSNKSFTFDGVDDYVDCGNPAGLQITGALTISAWVKINSTSPTQVCILSKDDVTNRSYQLWGRRAVDGFPAFVIFSSNNSYIVSGTTDLRDSQWHHIVSVFTPNTSMKIYIDDVLEATNTTSIPSSIDNDPANFEIGRFGFGNYEMSGNIDEVAIFDVELSASDVTSIFNNGVPQSLESFNPISHWRMGEDATWNGTNWTLNDNGSGGNNGTSQNMVLASRTNDVPLFSTKSILFDGVDDYVTFGSMTIGSGLAITGDISISMWLKFSNSGGTEYAMSMGDQYGIYTSVGTIRGFSRIGGSFTALSSVGTFNDNAWHHVLYVKNSTNMLLYIDGSLNASNTSGGTTTISGLDMRLGARYTTANFYDGSMDEVAIWDSEINISDVWDGSGKPFDISSSNPISWWRMGDYDSYPTLIDRGSGNNNGTMTNMTSASIVDDVPE